MTLCIQYLYIYISTNIVSCMILISIIDIFLFPAKSLDLTSPPDRIPGSDVQALRVPFIRDDSNSQNGQKLIQLGISVVLFSVHGV